MLVRFGTRVRVSHNSHLQNMVVEIRPDCYASELYSLTESLEERTGVDGDQFNWQSDLSHGDDGAVEGSWAHADTQRQESVEDNETHHLLKSDLVEHINNLKRGR
jgi:hypothetical protein